jgi:hypothetical protein
VTRTEPEPQVTGLAGRAEAFSTRRSSSGGPLLSNNQSLEISGGIASLSWRFLASLDAFDDPGATVNQLACNARSGTHC